MGLLPIIVDSNSIHGLVDSMVWLKGILRLIPNSAVVARFNEFARKRFEERQAKVLAFSPVCVRVGWISEC
jgi:hypothetical protein